MFLEKKFILLFLLFLVMAAILNSWPDPILQFLNLGVHAKIQPKISSSSREEVDFVIFAIFSNSGHLDPMLQIWDPGVWSCFMWNLTTMGAMVLEKKLFKVI